MLLPACNQRNPFLFVPRGTEKTHRQSDHVLTETQTELVLLSWTCPSYVVYYLMKTQGQQQVLSGEIFFPTTVFLLSHKPDQVNSWRSADIPKAFFQKVDESFSSSAFLPWTTAFPCILHIFPETTERAGTSFLQFGRLQIPPSASPNTEGQGQSTYELRLSTKGISWYWTWKLSSGCLLNPSRCPTCLLVAFQ